MLPAAESTLTQDYRMNSIWIDQGCGSPFLSRSQIPLIIFISHLYMKIQFSDSGTRLVLLWGSFQQSSFILKSVRVNVNYSPACTSVAAHYSLTSIHSKIKYQNISSHFLSQRSLYISIPNPPWPEWDPWWISSVLLCKGVKGWRRVRQWNLLWRSSHRRAVSSLCLPAKR